MKKVLLLFFASILFITGCMSTKYIATVRIKPIKSDVEIFIDGKKVGVTSEKGFAQVESDKMSIFKDPLLEVKNNEYYAFIQMDYIGKPKLNNNIRTASVTNIKGDRFYDIVFLYNINKYDKTYVSKQSEAWSKHNRVKVIMEPKLRLEPDIAGKEFGSPIPHGSYVSLIEYSRYSYWKVKLDNGNVGYISESFLSTDDKSIKQAMKTQREAIDIAIESREKAKQDSIKRILQAKRDSLESNPAWVKVFTVNLREKPTTESKITKKLEQGEKIFIQEKQGDWYKVRIFKYIEITPDSINIQFTEGWLFHTLVSKDEVKKLTYRERERIEYVNQHPNIFKKYKNAILKGQIMLGMTEDMVIASWGYPDDKNRSVYTFGVHEQWIYGSYLNRTYLYFEDGILKSWQD